MPNPLSSLDQNDIVSVTSKEQAEFQRNFMKTGMSNPEKNSHNLRFAPNFG
jgi:hypothetical protein